MPTFDAKTTDAARAVALCNCQRKALEASYGTADGKAIIDPFLSGMSIASLPHPVLRAVFIGASETVKARNNDGTRQQPNQARTTYDNGAAGTVDAINKANAEFWKARKAG
jgi:hypothetical protein